MLEAPATREFSTFAVGDLLRIRYVAERGSYEVMATGQNWDELIDDPGSEPGSFLFASAPHLISGYVYALTRHDHPGPELRSASTISTAPRSARLFVSLQSPDWPRSSG
jgi:hypothetical protein